MRQLADPADKQGPRPCFLCAAAACKAGSDEATWRHVLVSDERGVLLLNRYPYANGHLLAACVDHVGDLTSLAAAARGGLMELATVAQRLLETAVNPQGFNVGINVGRCAGAGVPGHIHMHVVPRWHGDTNFMPLFGQVRVIPQALEESFASLVAALDKVGSATD